MTVPSPYPPPPGEPAQPYSAPPSSETPYYGGQSVPLAEPVPPPGYPTPPPGYSVPPGYAAPPPGYSVPPPGYAPPAYGYTVPPGYGVAPGYPGTEYSDKSKLVAGLLSLLLGLGIGRFYTGHIGLGVAQLLVTILTCGLGQIWCIVDGILILVNGGTDAQGRPLRPS